MELVQAYVSNNAFDKPLLARSEIPDVFLEEHYVCCKLFCDLQVDTIERNISLYNHMTTEDSEFLYQQQQHLAQTFINQFGLRPIPKQRKLVKPSADFGMKVLL